MPKVLLIHPSALYAPFWGQLLAIKAHLLDLFSYLKYKGIDVAVLDLEIEIGRPETESERKAFREKAADLISQRDFDIVGISCWSSFNYLSTLVIADVCRSINDECCIVVGGHHPTAVPSDFADKDGLFDFVVCGEGERALLDICRKKERRRERVEMIYGASLDLTRDFPLDWAGYQYATQNLASHIFLSRGCPFSCSFCIERHKISCLEGNGQSGWRSYSADVAIEKVRRLKDACNPIAINFHDPCFGYRKSWRRDFLYRLADVATPDCVFWAETRADTLTKEDIDILAEMNFCILFGLETGSPQMLSIMNKTGNPQRYLDQSREVIQYMNQREVPYDLSMIFNHPGETYETYKTTIRYIESLLAGQEKISGRVSAQSFFFSPGSHVFFNLEYYEREYGTVVNHENWWKEEAEHSMLARSVIASEDLARRSCGTDYWMEAISELAKEMVTRVPSRVKRIRKLQQVADSLSCSLSKANSF